MVSRRSVLRSVLSACGLVALFGLPGCTRLMGKAPPVCGWDIECAATSWCSNGQCVASKCAAEPSACAPYACGQRACTTFCQSDDACAPGAKCELGQCVVPTGPVVPSCLSDLQCPSGLCCWAGTCEYCGIDDPGLCPICQAGEVCENGTCIDPCAGVFCGSGEVCDGGLCEPACAGKECGTEGGVNCGVCDSGEVCGVGQLCVSAACDTEAPLCVDGGVAVCEQGALVVAQDCGADLVCVSGDLFCRMPCEEGERRCVDGVLGECNADGAVDITRQTALDCGAQNLNCTELGCGDVLELRPTGVSTPCLEGQAAIAGLYQAMDDAILYRFAATVQIQRGATLTYRVHEADDSAGPFEKIWEGQVPFSAGLPLQHVGPLAPLLPLKGGKYYLLSVERSSLWAQIYCLMSDASFPRGSLVPTGKGAELANLEEPLDVSQWEDGIAPFDIDLFVPAPSGVGGAGGAGGAP